MKDTILFDLDGTLVDSLYDLADAVNFALTSLKCKTRTLDEVRNFVGNGADNLLKRALPEDKKELSDEALKLFKQYYNVNLCNKTVPYDGIYDLIVELKSKGYKVGIVTNKPDDSAKLIGNKLFDGKIEAIVGSDLNQRKKKPDPEPVDYCLSLLGSDRDSAIFVGDSEVDIATAQNTGLYCIGVSWGFRSADVLADADVIVNNSSELKRAIYNKTA